MKKLVVALACLGLSMATNAYQVLPDAKPARPVWAQKVADLLDAANRGDWKAACDVAPTGTAPYEEFTQFAILSGAQTKFQVERFCQNIIKGGSTDAKGRPVGIRYHIEYFNSDDGKNTETSRKLVVAKVQFGENPEQTVVFQVELARIPWDTLSARCGKPVQKCPPLRWYVLTAS